MLNEDEYIAYYEQKGKTIDQIAKPNSPLNERQLLSKYSKYCRKEEKKQSKTFKVDEEWKAVKILVEIRDQGVCQLINKLPQDLVWRLVRNSAGYHKVLDPAHKLGKGAYPKLKYEVSNVYTLNRYSHSCLDFLKSPITGVPISTEDRNIWWQIISGEIKYKENLWQERV